MSLLSHTPNLCYIMNEGYHIAYIVWWAKHLGIRMTKIGIQSHNYSQQNGYKALFYISLEMYKCFEISIGILL